MEQFRMKRAFRSANRCKSYLWAQVRTLESVLFFIGLQGCEPCKVALCSINALEHTSEPLAPFIKATAIISIKISQPEQLAILDFRPTEFPTILWYLKGEIQKGWAGFPIFSDTIFEKELSRAFLEKEFSSCLELIGGSFECM